MSHGTAVRRLARMGPQELAFRAEAEARKLAGRVRHAIAPPRWRRDGLADAVIPGSIDGLPAAVRARDYLRAHGALAGHFAARRSCWPIQARWRNELRAAILQTYPEAAASASCRADTIVNGRCDLLGYRGLEIGRSPDWHLDPVHRRSAPSGYWASVPYLDATFGDHKIIWELNRHQHWLVLGRAFWLTGEERYARACVEQLGSWLRSNPPLEGINWASMLELAFRCISWTYAVEFFAASALDGQPWLVDLLVGLDRQLTHVEQNLSTYFSPNTHLTGEALALYAVSRAFPELRRSARRARIGRTILLQQASRQVRPDGGHAELSAHYHRYSTDFYLLATMVARASGDPAAGRFEAAAMRQAEYLRTIADDSGRLPLLGDDDGGQLFAFGDARPAEAAASLGAAAEILAEPALAVSPIPEEAFWIAGAANRAVVEPAASMPWPSRWLPSSGYFVSRRGGGHLLFDAGPHGFLNGGHAHADALAVTLTIEGRQVLIDPGTATYTMDSRVRDRFRSPRMHNAAVIDGREHATPRGPFHWERFADARLLAHCIGEGFDFAQGTHDGHSPVRHVRTVAAIGEFGWLVVDHVLGAGEHELESWWHLHPALECELRSERRLVCLAAGSGWSVPFALSTADYSVLRDHPMAAFAPEYGRLEAAPVIRFHRRATAPFATAVFIVSPRYAAADVALEEVALVAPAPAAFDGRAFGLRMDSRQLAVLVATPTDGQARPWPPGAAWGTPSLRTDARFVAALVDADGCRTVAIANGSIADACGHDRHRGVASAVHG